MATSKQSAIIEKLTEAFGSFPTLYGFTIVLNGYIVWNLMPDLPHFDPYPFNFMTFIVSILANYQTLIVAISQKGQLLRDREAKKNSDLMLESILSLLKNENENTIALRKLVQVMRSEIHVLIKQTESE